MIYTIEDINSLRCRVENKLSKYRFIHTLGVEKMAVYLGEKIMPEYVDKLRCAALLHDISKEYSEAEQLSVINKYGITLDEGELNEHALWHAKTAPSVIAHEFSRFADRDILSAVYNHTIGSPDMSVFDEIILLADYIEEGRKYQSCINLREEFLAELDRAKTREEAVISLHRAVYKSLDNNIKEFISRGKDYHIRTELTRDAIYKKFEGQNNG